MGEHAHEFWTSDHRYEDLAREFERNIEIVHPGAVSGSKSCAWCYHCEWCATKVIYYEYRGERPTSG